LTEAPRELSGGGWAADRPATPTDPAREARKFLLRGRHGDFIVKFAGIDRAARAKFARARELHQAGFCPEPLDLRYGFMIERYVEGEPAAQIPEAHLIRYCAFRRERFPAKRQGSTLAELLAMAEYNIRKAVPDIRYDFAGRWKQERLARLQDMVEPVHIDGRLQWWEWRRAGDRLLKTDAVDHSESHDLVGCQDILWDVAGATVELDVAEGETSALADAFTKGVPLREELLKLMQLCYLGFQLGWWSLSSTAQGAARADWYGGKVKQMLPA
jgi:hypothetical protein